MKFAHLEAGDLVEAAAPFFAYDTLLGPLVLAVYDKDEELLYLGHPKGVPHKIGALTFLFDGREVERPANENYPDNDWGADEKIRYHIVRVVEPKQPVSLELLSITIDESPTPSI